MTHKSLVAMASAVALSALIGCSRGKGQANGPAPQPDEPDTTGDGGAMSCDREVALQCPDGMSDGCLRQGADGVALTAYHVCMPADEQASQPCAQEIARQCPDGLVDACLVDPPAASTHVCVQASAEVTDPVDADPAPESDGGAPVEPDGATDPG
jgi:hypothetical protein